MNATVFRGIAGFGYYVKIVDGDKENLFYRNTKGFWRYVGVFVDLGSKYGRPALNEDESRAIIEEFNNKKKTIRI